MSQTSRPERTRNLPNGDYQARHEDLGVQATYYFRRIGGFKEEFQCFREVVARFLDGITLTSDVEFRTQGDVTVSFALNDGSELAFLLHDFVLPHAYYIRGAG